MGDFGQSTDVLSSMSAPFVNKAGLILGCRWPVPDLDPNPMDFVFFAWFHAFSRSPYSLI